MTKRKTLHSKFDTAIFKVQLTKGKKENGKLCLHLAKSVRVQKTVNSLNESLAGKKNIHFVKCKSGNTIEGWCSRKENRLCGVIPAKFDTIP